MTCDLSDVRWLVSPESRSFLAIAARQATPLHRRAAKLRQALTTDRAHLVLEQTELRARGRNKYEASDRLFFTRRGLEQATDQWVAAHKAKRFLPEESVADLCCGIGGDLMALAARGPAEGIDSDPVIAIFADANVQTVLRASSSARAHCMAAERVDLAAYGAWHMDPDRRGDGRRTVDMDQMSPNAQTIDLMLGSNGNAAIKLAPATSPPPSWRERAELEWISRDRECRQLVAWFGRLAQSPGRRSATVLDAGGAVVARVSGEPRPLPPPAAAILDYVFEPDSAVLAAGLAGELAHAHGILPIAPTIPYFTSGAPVDTRALAAFRVMCVLPPDEKRLAVALRARGIGRIEIKCRGVRIAPDELRRRLRLQGDGGGVLLLTQHNCRAIAILAKRIDRAEDAFG